MMVIVMIRVIHVQIPGTMDVVHFVGKRSSARMQVVAHGILRLSVASTHNGLALAIDQEMLVAAVRHAPSGHVAATTAAA